MFESLALLAAFVVLYSTIAGGVERTWISGPMVFTAFGLLIGLPLTILFLFLALAEGGEIEGGTSQSDWSVDRSALAWPSAWY